MSSVKIEDRLKDKLRIRSYREWKKMQAEQREMNQPQISSTPYRSKQAKGKAVKRTQSSLPPSLHKRHCVVQSLAKTVGLKVDSTQIVHLVRKQNNWF